MPPAAMSDAARLRRWHRGLEYARVIEHFAGSAPKCAEEKLLLGLSMAMGGDQDGFALLKEAAEREPATDAWRSDLALCHLLRGDAERAHALMRDVLASGRAGAVDYSRMAAVCLARGQDEQARDHYREAVHCEPGRDVWHANLAGVEMALMEYESAMRNYELALRANPGNRAASAGRLRLLEALGRQDELLAELESRLEKEPDDPRAKIQLARALDRANRPGEALARLRDALCPPDETERRLAELAGDWRPPPRAGAGGGRSEPGRAARGSADAAGRATENGGAPEPAAAAEPEQRRKFRAGQCAILGELATLWRSKSRWRHAYVNYRRLDELLENEQDISARLGQAACLIEMARHGEAEALLDSLDPGQAASVPARLQRSNLYCETGRYGEAEKLLRDLREERPANPSVLGQLGNTLMWLGKFDEAADMFSEAARYNPAALASVASAGRIPEDGATLERMCRLAEDRLMPASARTSMCFALAEAFHQRREYERAFGYLQRGNRLENDRLGYDPAAFTRQVDAIIGAFDEAWFASLKPVRHADRTPVFVVGMPRSGTTLTEQLLCSHPLVFGAGELSLIGELSQLMPRVLKTGLDYPECMREVTPHLREEAARFYLHGLESYDSEHRYVVDKMPHNFLHLGLIATIFPGAKLIHSRRDARDTGFSNYQRNFHASHGGMGYAFDLKNIALQINDYQRLMAHWRETLPIPLFEFHYEELVEDQRRLARELLEFVGLDWDDGVLDFHRHERAVRTASITQVRRPIYQSSRQKWKDYAPWLGELLEHLDDPAPERVAKTSRPD